MQSSNAFDSLQGILRLAGLAGPLMGLSFPLAAQATAGSLDPTFGVGGQLTLDFDQSTDIANAVAVQPDGKLVVVGSTYVNSSSGEDFAVSRHLPDGSLDPAFGVGGLVTTNFPNLAAVASSVVVQPDGKIVVAGGAFPVFTFAGDFKIVRYNPDGSLDASFGSGGIVTTSFPGQGSYAFDVLLQPDGKIVAAGTDFVAFSPSEQSSDTDFALARYNANGTLDSTFGTNGRIVTDFAGFNDDAFSVLIQPDGKLVAFGSALSLANYYDFAAARYLANGALDVSFGTGGKLRTDFGNADFDRARSAVLQPDGKIVAAGFTIYNGGLTQPFAVVRYLANGLLDTSFNGDGKLEIDFGSFMQTAYKVLLQDDGKIITVGYPNTESSDSDFLLARCHPDGSLDTTFGTGGKVRTSFGDLNGGAYGAALQPDGRVVAVGFIATFSNVGVEFALARYLADPWTIYCTSGTSASACHASISATGSPSATATSGFVVAAQGVEGSKDGLFYFGSNGRQANPWGNGTSFQCVVPPVVRAPLMSGTGTNGACDGSFTHDLNALWAVKPAKNPGSGAVVQAQLWYRDPLNTSNQTTSLSNAIEFLVGP
jgi:uncharacterized delta-60 repeat protein